MSTPASIPAVSFHNTLNFSVDVYDSFSDQDTSNYFGTLTLVGTVPANTTAPVQPIHAASAFIVSNAATQAPLARLLSSALFSTSPFGVGPADVAAMTQTTAFIDFITHNPTDPVATSFQALWKNSTQPLVQPVNQFFAQHPAYSSCTFATYMMGITSAAQQPASKGQPLSQATYSLSTLVQLLGGSWPPAFPDIVVSKFTCDTQNDVLAIRAEIDLDKLPAQSDEALQFFGSLFSVKQLQVAVHFNYGFNMGALGTRLSFGLDALHVPFGGPASLAIHQPTVTIDINPLFKFVVFTVAGSIPFSIFGKSFEADVSMVIDNIEASFGVVIKGDNTSLPAPPIMQGVHFDEFGVGIGVIFEPLGGVIGLSGKLHIGTPGSGSQVALDDDTFVVVCQLEEEVPNPLYISFYVPQMHLTDVLTVFTNSTTTLDVPVSFTDLSFQWAENPMEPVVLPDGSLSSMGYGFSGAANILGFSFYGDVAINLTNGLTATIEMAPLALGSVFSLGGDGTGVTIKVDASGNPIKNNQLATTAAQRQALKTATTKQLVPPGGPVLTLQTFASPFLHLNGKASLFEVENYQLTADITAGGIVFEVDFGGVLTSTMSCTLADFHNLATTFQFGINQSISLPSIGGVSLGSLPLQAAVNAHLSLSTSTSDLVLQVGGGFDFEGLSRTFGDFTADAHIQKVSDLLAAIVAYIEQTAGQLFSDLLGTAAAWAGKVKQGVITAADSVASVLKSAFNQTADQVAATMQGAGYALNDVAGQLKAVFDPAQVASALTSAFSLTAQGVAQAMQQVGYAANDVAGALKTIFNPSQVAGALQGAFNLGAQGVAQAMQQVGYAASDVAGALKDTFGNDIGQIATALQSAYGWSAGQIQGVLQQIGFSASDIGNAFQSLGGDFANLGSSILSGLQHLDPTHWG